MTAFVENEVLELLRTQASLYARLEQFATSQRSLVRDEDSGPLLSLLADRQRLSTELTRVASRLATARGEWPAFRERLSPVERVEADELLRGASASLRRVIESDEQDARLLGIRKERVKRELRETQTMGQAISAYGSKSAAASGSRRLDESS